MLAFLHCPDIFNVSVLSTVKIDTIQIDNQQVE